MSLRLDGVCVDIAGRRIVSGIDLTVGDGQFVGLLGPNGSGKSTILRAIYRVHRPSRGRVLVDGADLLALKPRDAARRVAVVAQESVSEFDFTVREIVMTGRLPNQQAFSRDTDADQAVVEGAMDRVGCGHLAHRGFNTLSGGEKQLALIARALAQGADHLVLDEPTNHLDIQHQVGILELVAGLGVSVLAALHDLSLAALFCGAVHVLAGGRIVAGGPPGKVITPATIRAAYGADVLVIEHPDTGTPHLIPRRIQPKTPLHLSGRTTVPSRIIATCAALTAAGLLAGCASSSPSASTTPSAQAAAAKYPVTVTNCGTPVTYDQAPERAVSNDINTTEDMLALGLQSRMAGDFGVTGDGPAGHPVPSQYLAAFNQVPDKSPDYFTLEELVGLHPDFLFAGWNYGLETGTNLTPAGLAKYGIKTLALTESCVHVQPGTDSVSINDTYTDLRNLGAIFGVQGAAQRAIAGMATQVAAVRAKVASLAPVTVFDYDSGQSAPVTGPGLALPTALITLAGGTNVFGSLKKSWTSVSWEQVVAAQPQCIIINDYGTPTAAQKEKFLETFPATRNLPAVKNKCFLALSYDEVTPGPRNAEAVVAIAHVLHPAAFGLPPDGS